MTSLDKLPSLILKGTKILTLEYRDVKLIDSYNFIPISLERFPETFGLKELKKGFFPHSFNSPENFNYIGSIPSKSFFSANFFSENKKKEFETWYEKQTGIYNFKNEITEYCKSDVKLLKEGTLTFRRIILEITKGIDPFENCITIAGVCHLIYRTLHMEANTIGIIPVFGFNPEQKTSNKALQWIKFLCFSKNIDIKHSRNGGELQIGRYYVDGYHPETKTIYEFHG